ncbi:MAG: hypothetical protein K0S12_1991 [Bacteroidetes bacterium]|jgi:hypothetical protein|nr:hypothetical protein [Bacteroidota bacterium]
MKIYPLIAAAALVCFSACSSHEDKVKEEHDKGKDKVEEKSALVQGVGEGLKTSGKSAISALTEGVGAVIKGAEEGFDKGLTKVNLKADTSVSVFGIKIGKCGKYYSDSLKTNVVSAYGVFNEDFNNELLLIATDNDNQEVGRVKQKLNEKEGASKYIDFAFDKRMNIDIVKEFKLSVNYKKKK